MLAAGYKGIQSMLEKHKAASAAQKGDGEDRVI
jgi:hypothetical protein